MFYNYIKITFRNLWKQKLFSFVNITGFALGLAVSIIISIYVINELSYDKFHTNYDKIYQTLRIGSRGDSNYLIGVTSGPFAPALLNDFPQSIEASVRVMPTDGLITYKNHSFFEKKFFLADDNFFDVFSFQLKTGNSETALTNPNSVILTQEMAVKYFGNTDPIGKTITLDTSYELTVTGILDDLPDRSHLNFDFVAPIKILNDFDWFHDWWNNSLITYVVIDSPQEAENVEAGFPAFMDKYFAKDFAKNGNRIDLTLQPLSEVYFGKDVRYDKALHGDKNVVTIFSIIAAFVLIIACINFMNLSTARSSRRAKEIGVRKVLGAVRTKLVWQFLSESFLVTLISILIAVAAVELILPVFNAIFNLDLTVNFLQPKVVLALCFFLAVVTLISGSYPALLLSSFMPVKVLKSRVTKTSESAFIRKGLVVFQFAVSVFLIAGTLLVGNQLRYMQDKNKGFDEEQVVLVEINNSEIRNKHEVFKERLLNEPGIVNISSMSGEPGGFYDTMSHNIQGHDETYRLRTVFSDHDYVKTFGLKIVAGRDFSQEFGTDENEAVLLNETAVKNLGWTNDEAIGQEVSRTMFGNEVRRVVGVIKDYHFSSLRDKIDPLLVTLNPSPRIFGIKINTSNLQNTLAQIEKQWANIAPAFPIEITFLDDKLEQHYRQEKRESRLFVIFAIIAILIACLGSFALAAYSAEERTKEIGIRKVLGSSALSIFILLSRDFIKMVLIAAIVASPVAWFFMNEWLADFAYRVDISADLFIGAALITILMVMITVSWQSVKASLSNPIKGLRHE